MSHVYVLFAWRLFVLMLKIHCCAVGSHRKAVSGVVESTVSLTTVTTPLETLPCWNDLTTPAVPIEFPFASQARNFAGTVLPCLNTLEPSALIGCKIT